MSNESTPDTHPYGSRKVDDLSLKVADATGFSQVLQRLIEDILGSDRGARTDQRNGFLMLQAHEADMLIFMANQTMWAAEAADQSFREMVL